MRYLVFLMWASPLLSGAQVYTNQTIPLGIEAFVSNNLYGAGVSFADFDMDGDDDLTFALDQDLAFYRNDNGVAVEVSFPFDPVDNAKHPVWVDFDNDGDRDFFISCYLGYNKMYRNDGILGFTDISATCGLGDDNGPHWGTTWGDYDLDGDLDVYICSYVFAYEGSDAYNYWDHLYRNNGDGTFTDMSLLSGIEDGISTTFQAVWMDYDNDRWPDLYVINDKYYANHLYHNNGDGTFTDIAVESGTAIASTDAMTASCADFNSDGYEDIFVTNTSLGPASLLRNNGDGTFTDVASASGTALNILGWAGNWFDYDLDADPDLYVCEYFPQFSGVPNRVMRNNGNETFTNVQSSVFPFEFSNSYSSAVGDWNADGFPDMAISNFAPQNAGVWISTGNSMNHWFSVDPVGVVSNREGVGVRITVSTNSTHEVRYTYAGENYIGQNSFTEQFGIEQNLVVDTLKMEWPSGHTDVFTNLNADQHHTLEEGSGVLVSIAPTGLGVLCPGSSVELDAGEFSSYSWSTGETERFIEIASPGIYQVQVTTELGFTGTGYFTVTSASEPEYSVEIISPSCTGANDGMIQITPLSNDLTLAWNDGGSDWSIGELSGGLYSGVFLTSEGCQVPFSHLIEDPLPYTPQLSVENVSCHGNADGSIVLLEGAPGYVLTWYDGSSAEVLSGLPAGIYPWTATNGICNFFGEIVVDQPQEIGANLIVEPVSCFGMSDGAISEMNIYGGTPPYDVVWNVPDTAALNAGAYFVIIQDSMGCEQQVAYSVEEPGELIVNWQAVCENGLMTIYTNISGGNFPYEYSWDTGDTTPSVSGLSVTDLVTLTVVDSEGCTATVTEMGCLVGISEAPTHWVTIMPNPVRDMLYIISSGQIISWELASLTGEVCLSGTGSPGFDGINVSGLAAGCYVGSFWQGDRVVVRQMIVKE